MPEKDSLFVFFGMVASGKSTLAMNWAKRHNMKYYNSDVVRKEIAGLAPTAEQKESLDKGIYSKEFTRKTYDALLAHAEEDITAGRQAVLDASYLDPDERERIRSLARKLGVHAYFIFCSCSEEETRKRLAVRAQDPEAVSDGRWEIYLAQKKRFAQPEEEMQSELISINTEASLEELMNRLDEQLRNVQ